MSEAPEAPTAQGERPPRIEAEADPKAQLFPPENERRGKEITGAIGRKALPATLRLFGKDFDPIARPIKRPSAIERGLANLLGGIFANRGPLSDHGRIQDYRNAEAVRKALDTPLAAPSDVLGPITIFRPGLGNTAPGPAQIARLAQYTQKIVIAYANPGEGREAQLREIDEVDGVKLPPELKGKVFAIGSPENLMITYEQASDLFLRQLESMRASGLDLSNARATVVAHSQGGLDAMITRKRLEQAGFENTFGKLITLATPFRGSPVSDETMAGILAEPGQYLFAKQALRAVNALDPDYVAKRIDYARDQHLVDISLIGQTEAGPEGRSDIRRFFKVSDAAIEMVKSFASVFRGADVRENDGLVTVASQLLGKLQHRLSKSYDHAGIAEDPAIADEIARLVAG